MFLNLLFSSFPSIPPPVILEFSVASNYEVMVNQTCHLFLPCRKIVWKLSFLTAGDKMGFLASLQGVPFAKVSAGIHSSPEDAAASPSQGCAAKEKVFWSWTGCVDLTQSPGKALDYGSLSTCLPSTHQPASQNPLSKDMFLMEFCTPKTMTYVITAIKNSHCDSNS